MQGGTAACTLAGGVVLELSQPARPAQAKRLIAARIFVRMGLCSAIKAQAAP